MKTSELMIWDWVTFKDCQQDDEPTIIRVDGILSNHTVLAYIDNSDALDDIYAGDLSGIPLSPEILEKNGFATDDGSHYQIQERALELELLEIPFGNYQFDMVRTTQSKNKRGQSCYISYFIARINYVHELQHALRLCGIDKEIEL